MIDALKEYSATPNNSKWENIIKRECPLYKRNNDIRSEFERDYTRIIHSTAYRRMKGKTQVFYSPKNDHICTRLEHVMHVESISYTISKYLGLNVELTKAIATAHDLGHSPFGHEGERILSVILQRDADERFWHEKNGLNMVDNIELLEDPEGNKKNLDLTYAVRDGIISHCGEIDENMLRPREEYIDLNEYKLPNQYSPYTWEACVVKIADKISYLGRDLSDAKTLGILDDYQKELSQLLNRDEVINNTVIINDLIYDLCINSNKENGLCFSDEKFKMIKELKKFNYEKIYLSKRLEKSTEYFKMVLNTLYGFLKGVYKDDFKDICPELTIDFKCWIKDYWNLERAEANKNKVLFNLKDEKDYTKAVIYYISGMTDNYAIDMYNKIIRF